MKKVLLITIVSLTVSFAQAQCQANFQYTSTGLNINLTSTSINAGSTLNSQTPTWDFGDGSAQVTGSSTINYTYQNSGIYNVCIEIFTWPTSWTTCSSIYCDSVIVGNISSASWDCVNGACIDPTTGLGQYTSLSACLFDSCIVMPPSPSWDCIGNACYDPGNGMGMYASQIVCASSCVISTVEEYTNNKELLKKTDLLGRERKGAKNEVILYIYDDGTVEKKLIFE